MELSERGFLKKPIVTVDRERDCNGDEIVTAYVELRPGIRASHSVQPNPNVLLFFEIAEDGLPVGFSVHGPISGVAVCEIVSTLVEGPNGPEGVEQSARHQFIPASELPIVMRGMGKSLEGLETV